MFFKNIERQNTVCMNSAYIRRRKNGVNITKKENDPEPDADNEFNLDDFELEDLEEFANRRIQQRRD